MTDTRNLAKLDVDRDLALSDATLVPVAFREPLPLKTVPHRLNRRLVPTLGIAVLLIAAATAYGSYYWVVGRFLESTDDAYVQADSTIVAPKVSGYLSEVLVEDNQPVKAAQPLAKIDDRDYVASLDQAKADVATAQADIENVTATLHAAAGHHRTGARHRCGRPGQSNLCGTGERTIRAASPKSAAPAWKWRSRRHRSATPRKPR